MKQEIHVSGERKKERKKDDNKTKNKKKGKKGRWLNLMGISRKAVHFKYSQIKFPFQPRKAYTQKHKPEFSVMRGKFKYNLLHETVGKELYSCAFKP